MDQTRAGWKSLGYISLRTHRREHLVGDLASYKEIPTQPLEFERARFNTGDLTLKLAKASFTFSGC